MVHNPIRFGLSFIFYPTESNSIGSKVTGCPYPTRSKSNRIQVSKSNWIWILSNPFAGVLASLSTIKILTYSWCNTSIAESGNFLVQHFAFSVDRLKKILSAIMAPAVQRCPSKCRWIVKQKRSPQPLNSMSRAPVYPKAKTLIHGKRTEHMHCGNWTVVSDSKIETCFRFVHQAE